MPYAVPLGERRHDRAAVGVVQIGSDREVKGHDALAFMLGPVRYRTYGKLAVDLARNAAPWVTYANGTFRDSFS
jgi:hypothetical protein